MAINEGKTIPDNVMKISATTDHKYGDLEPVTFIFKSEVLAYAPTPCFVFFNCL
jgi:hypothetical protein